MERLTVIKDGEVNCAKWDICESEEPCNECEQWALIAAKLARYEDLEEQELLLSLPEKVKKYTSHKGEEGPVLELIDPSGDFKAKPCPFCGSDEIKYWQYSNAAGLRWRIACLGCMAMIDPGWIQSYGYLAEMWNARAVQKQQTECENTEERQVFSGLELAKIAMALSELEKYRKAENDGRLVMLPCKPGDDLFFVNLNAKEIYKKSRV